MTVLPFSRQKAAAKPLENRNSLVWNILLNNFFGFNILHEIKETVVHISPRINILRRKHPENARWGFRGKYPYFSILYP